MSRELTIDQLRALVRATLATRPLEISCDEWLARIGRFAEAVLAGEPISNELEVVAQHLEVCKECAEELDAIIEALSPSE